MQSVTFKIVCNIPADIVTLWSLNSTKMSGYQANVATLTPLGKEDKVLTKKSARM